MIVDGKKIATHIQEEMKRYISGLKGRKPCLAVVLVGDHPSSVVYVRNKIRSCESIGIHSVKNEFPSHISQEEILQHISALNQNPSVDGILVQLPLPNHIDPVIITQAIDPKKDVDGFHPINIGKLAIGETDGFTPCTPLGIKTLIQVTKIPTQGKHIVILGRSNIVGKPMVLLLLDRSANFNATVTVANSHTPNIEAVCQEADLIIAAIGSPHFVKDSMVKKGAAIIDVGINFVESNGKRVALGDVDFENVAKKCSYITPVPGGVGPMTIAMLLSNTLLSYKRRFSLPLEGPP